MANWQARKATLRVMEVFEIRDGGLWYLPHV